MNPNALWRRSSQVAVVLFIVLAMGVLLTAVKEILIPVALAVLIAFLLHPLVKRIQRLGVNRVVAVILVVGSTALLAAGMGAVVSRQIKTLADDLPNHQENITQRVIFLKKFLRGGTVDKLQRMVDSIDARATAKVEQEEKTKKASRKISAADAVNDAVKPEDIDVSLTPGNELEVTNQNRDGAEDNTTVRVFSNEGESPLTTLPYFSPILDLLAQAGIVLLLVLFFLVQQSDLRDRIVTVAGRGALATTTKALEDAGTRISRYLIMQFFINASFGTAVAIGLYLIGVPYAMMWGLFAATLRYIPYIGPWIAAVLPVLTSLVVFTGWSGPLMVVGLFVVLELISNNVMEPILYGHSVGLSEVGVIVSAIIWGWFWGPIGLVLATPMTVCLVVLGKYVPGLQVFDLLLGDRPPVGPHVRLYQRLLAKDDEEAEDVIRDHLKKHTIIETSDRVLLPMVQLIHQDLIQGQIDEEDADWVLNALQNDLVDLEEWAMKKPDKSAKEAAGSDSIAEEELPVILGLPAHSLNEEIVVRVLEQSIRDLPCRFHTISTDLLVSERLSEIGVHASLAVCISALPPGDLAHTRQLIKRIRQQYPGLKVFVGRWSPQTQGGRDEHHRLSDADEVVASIDAMHGVLQSLLQRERAARTNLTESPSRSAKTSASHGPPARVF
jgi:predicted PurR-regulated permease PerM